MPKICQFLSTSSLQYWVNTHPSFSLDRMPTESKTLIFTLFSAWIAQVQCFLLFHSLTQMFPVSNVCYSSSTFASKPNTHRPEDWIIYLTCIQPPFLIKPRSDECPTLILATLLKFSLSRLMRARLLGPIFIFFLLYFRGQMEFPEVRLSYSL